MQDHVLIEPELDMGEVAHVELVDRLFSLGRGGALEQFAGVAQTNEVDDGVHVGGGSEVQPGADVFPVVLLVGLLVLPIEVFVLLVLPEHQVRQYFLQ